MTTEPAKSSTSSRLDPAAFDVVEASRRVWLARWAPEAASGMAVFTAILRSHQMLSNEVSRTVKEFGLTLARYEVLTWLATDPESSLTLSGISRTLRIPPATVTNIIDRLEKDLLVRRVPHSTDARTTLAVITERGRQISNDATEALNAGVYERLGLSPDQRDQLVELLAVLRANGNEFDVERSEEVIEQLVSRQPDVGQPAPRTRNHVL